MHYYIHKPMHKYCILLCFYFFFYLFVVCNSKIFDFFFPIQPGIRFWVKTITPETLKRVHTFVNENFLFVIKIQIIKYCKYNIIYRNRCSNITFYYVSIFSSNFFLFAIIHFFIYFSIQPGVRFWVKTITPVTRRKSTYFRNCFYIRYYCFAVKRLFCIKIQKSTILDNIRIPI